MVKSCVKILAQTLRLQSHRDKLLIMPKSIIFILPKNTKRILNEGAWEFQSNGIVSNLVSIKVLSFLNVKFVEEFLDIEKYQNEHTQANIIYTNKEIEEIYIRTSLEKDSFLNQLFDLLSDDEVDIFVPN